MYREDCINIADTAPKVINMCKDSNKFFNSSVKSQK